MCGDRKVGKLHLMMMASVLTLALVALPVVPSLDGASLNGKAAYAKSGKGGGNAGGRGGRGGKGGIGGASIGTLTDSHGKGHTGTGLGHGKNAVSGVLSSHNGSHLDTHGALASLLGSLNAAHAIANGNTNDNLNSRVGQIRAYMEAFNTGDIPGAAEDLIAASNRDLESMDTDTVEDVVGGVNDLLGTNVVDDEARERAVAETISPP